MQLAIGTTFEVSKSQPKFPTPSRSPMVISLTTEAGLDSFRSTPDSSLSSLGFPLLRRRIRIPTVTIIAIAIRAITAATMIAIVTVLLNWVLLWIEPSPAEIELSEWKENSEPVASGRPKLEKELSASVTVTGDVVANDVVTEVVPEEGEEADDEDEDDEEDDDTEDDDEEEEEE